MHEDYAVVSLTPEAHKGFRRTGLLVALAPAWVCVFGVLILVDFMGLFGELDTVMTIVAVWCLLSPVLLGFGLRRVFRLAFGNPTLVSGSDSLEGVTLTQRYGRAVGTTVLVPSGSTVTFAPVDARTAKDNAPVDGLSVTVGDETTVLALTTGHDDWDFSPGEEHFARHGIRVKVEIEQPAATD